MNIAFVTKATVTGLTVATPTLGITVMDIIETYMFCRHGSVFGFLLFSMFASALSIERRPEFLLRYLGKLRTLSEISRKIEGSAAGSSLGSFVVHNGVCARAKHYLLQYPHKKKMLSGTTSKFCVLNFLQYREITEGKSNH